MPQQCNLVCHCIPKTKTKKKAEHAKTTGIMTWEELDVVCAAGHVDCAIVDDIKNCLKEKQQTGVEFLDFLSYLPLFLGAQARCFEAKHAPHPSPPATNP